MAAVLQAWKTPQSMGHRPETVLIKNGWQPDVNYDDLY